MKNLFLKITALLLAVTINLALLSACNSNKNFEGMELIRPLYLVREEDIIAWKNYNNLDFINCACKFTENCAIDEDSGKRREMKRLIKELKIRKETTIDVSYTFTKLGNTLVNFSLVSSLKYKNLIISNPTIYLKEKEQIEIIKNELTNKEKYSNVILNLDNISNFSNSLDRIVFVTRDNEFIETNVNDKVVVIEDNIYIRNIICKAKDNYVICYHDYEKEELKKFDKLKIKYKLISIYDIDKYLEVKYE